MPLNEKNGAVISLEEAKKLVQKFRMNYPNEIKASHIDADLVKDLLNQDGCVGMKIYYGYDELQNKLCPIFVGVSADNKDMTAGLILDKSVTCPPSCDVTSELMNI